MMPDPPTQADVVISVDPMYLKSNQFDQEPAQGPVVLPPAPSTKPKKSPLWNFAAVFAMLLLIANVGMLINLTVKGDDKSVKQETMNPGIPHDHHSDGHGGTTTSHSELPMKGDAYLTRHLTATFNPYPASDATGAATLDAGSQVWITEKQGGGLMIHYFLTGLPEEEAMGGFNVYTGTTCITLEEQLGLRGFVHSPVLSALWEKELGATSVRGSVDVGAVGFGLDQIEKHTFVVKEQSGRKIGCGALRYQHDHFDAFHLSAKFMAYPESDAKGAASLNEDSQVWMTANTDGSYTVHYFLTGLPASEESGGIHVHTGTSCDTHAQVLGHYYSTTEDPWSTKWTKAAGSTVAAGSVRVASPGFGLEMNERHAFVVHEQRGKRIACGVLHAVQPNVDRLKEANEQLQKQNEALRSALLAFNMVPGN